jgi:hypothetical protein
LSGGVEPGVGSGVRGSGGTRAIVTSVAPSGPKATESTGLRVSVHAGAGAEGAVLDAEATWDASVVGVEDAAEDADARGAVVDMVDGGVARSTQAAIAVGAKSARAARRHLVILPILTFEARQRVPTCAEVDVQLTWTPPKTVRDRSRVRIPRRK